MSFVIDFTHHHSQTLLDLVYACNSDTIFTPLSTSDIIVGSLTPPEADGRVTVTLTNRNVPGDAIQVRYYQLNLGDFITIPEKHLGWFDLSKGKPADLSVWSAPAMKAFEDTCTDLGMVISKAWENPAQCHVEYDIALDRYILVYECESFVYGPRARIVLPYNIGQDLTVKTLDGLNYDLGDFWGRKLQELAVVTRLGGFKYREFV
ncbi:hypothetical protein MLDJOKPK_00068 [Salmonella phage SPAsTU]|nr:hypothetical protein STsAS_073 [Salmonella phage STsAS]AWN09012.1 hypothetical protein MLDJOKPK_00068 [Salmonella phage SPAsTU]